MTLAERVANLSKAEKAVRDAEKNLVIRKREIGEAARASREKHRISLRDMARRCRVSASFLSDFELGRRWSDRLAESLIKEIGND